MTKSGVLAAVAKAAGRDPDQAESLTVDAGFIATHFPDIAKAMREEGAKAEHDRLAQIEAASMPGHENIITAHKADRSKTGADAALAVIAAEKAKLASMHKSLADDETKVSGIKSAAPEAASSADSENPRVEAAKIADAATAYVHQQAAKGITVSVAEAVSHVSKKG